MILGRILRAVGIAVLVALAGLVLVGLAPFALREKWTSGSVADTAAPLTGQVEAATDGLRRQGYSCADAITTPQTVTRSCNHVRGVATSQVQLVAAATTGVIQLVRTTIDQGLTRAETHRQVLNVVVQALGLPTVDQAQVVAAAGAGEETVLDLAWGTATIGIGDAADSTLRAAGSPGPGLTSSPATLTIPVDALAAAAQAHGYTCMTPQVQTIRSCGRSDGGYGDDLWLEGIDAHTTSVYLSVASTLHTRTRSHWVETMTETLGWVDTPQTRDLQAWLSASADAPGADSYVDGLRISFLVRHGEWTKETFGGISTECAPTVDDISACDPEPAAAAVSVSMVGRRQRKQELRDLALSARELPPEQVGRIWAAFGGNAFVSLGLQLGVLVVGVRTVRNARKARDTWAGAVAVTARSPALVALVSVYCCHRMLTRVLLIRWLRRAVRRAP